MENKKKKLPVYYLDISELDTADQEVNYTAFVDDPAIDRMFQAFDNQKQLFQADADRRIVTGALMVADLPIYRRDAQKGEYYVAFKPDVIMKIAQKYFRKGFATNVNLMHDEAAKVEGAYMFESFIIDKARGINAPDGFDGLSEGSWVGSFKVDNDLVWADIKAGKYKGFSVEGIFEMIPEGEMSEKELDKIVKQIDKL